MRLRLLTQDPSIVALRTALKPLIVEVMAALDLLIYRLLHPSPTMDRIRRKVATPHTTGQVVTTE